MEPQQLATKVAQLESRVATLEDEGKIVRGEVKQILTEIRSAILVRDNPFDLDGGAQTRAPVTIVQSAAPPVAKLELLMPEKPAEEHDRPHSTDTAPPPATPATATQPPLTFPVAPASVIAMAPIAAEAPEWSLLTIASLSAWAEEAVGRLGALRVEILLDLCEAAGHLTPASRAALSRITELETSEPAQPPSTNETAAILRQLDALINDGDDSGLAKAQALR